jgi:UDP-GlcNAc:undecaprenyl-phosphate GlcNAc-1-phosphate transferase
MYPFSAGLIAFLVATVTTPLLIKIAYKKNWVVAPRADRWHKKPTALMGGIAIFFASTGAMFFANNFEINWIIFIASLVMFLTGLADDLQEVKPIVKLIAQVVCTFALIYHGYYFGGGLLEWAGIPLTFFWVIGITNALNLLDNMDGLAAGIAGIVATIAAILGFMHGDMYLASMGFALAGAAFGFLIYNFNPAKIFMGDSGSLFLGFSISFLSIAVQKDMGSSSAILVMLIPISLMAIPIMDTTLVTIKRLVAGRRIDQGGKDHTSHRLVALGFTEKNAVLILYGICIVWGAVCILMLRTTVNNFLLTLLLLSILSGVFALALSKVKVYNETEEKLIYLRSRGYSISKNNDLFFRFFLMNKKLIIGLFSDILIIYFAFFIAADSTKTDLQDSYALLGLFICIKLSFFYISNLYSRMWRYMAVLELGGYFLSSIGSTTIIGILLLIFGKIDFLSPYFLLVDFLLTFTGVIVSRMAFRLMLDFINKSRQIKRRVIIYGAGDSGYLLVKELLQNHRYELSPIGWIDDDESKHNMLLYGFKILGGESQLIDVCLKNKVDLVLISTKSIELERENMLRDQLAQQNIELGRFSIQLNFGK